MKRSTRFPKVPKAKKRTNFFGQQISQSSDEAPDYIYPAELRKSIVDIIKTREDQQKIALAALYQLYKEQNIQDKQRLDEIQIVRNKYRQRTKQIVDQTRNIANGDISSNINSKVTDFWAKVIKNSSFQVIIQQNQIQVIDQLKNLIVDYYPESKQIRIHMHFGENKMFSNEVLKVSLIQKSIKIIEHNFDKPAWKKGFKTTAKGFFKVFTKIQRDDLINFYEYWLNFVLKELPQALTFYFELRQGTFNARIRVFESEEQEQQQEQEKPVQVQSVGLFGSSSFFASKPAAVISYPKPAQGKSRKSTQKVQPALFGSSLFGNPPQQGGLFPSLLVQNTQPAKSKGKKPTKNFASQQQDDEEEQEQEQEEQEVIKPSKKNKKTNTNNIKVKKQKDQPKKKSAKSNKKKQEEMEVEEQSVPDQKPRNKSKSKSKSASKPNPKAKATQKSKSKNKPAPPKKQKQDEKSRSKSQKKVVQSKEKSKLKYTRSSAKKQEEPKSKSKSKSPQLKSNQKQKQSKSQPKKSEQKRGRSNSRKK